MNNDSSHGLEVATLLCRNGLEPEKGATSMMDSINLETPEFMITVHRSGQVTAVVTAESGWEPEDITNTALGQAACRILHPYVRGLAMSRSNTEFDQVR